MRPSKNLENIFSPANPRIFKLIVCSIFSISLIALALNEYGTGLVAAAAQDENGVRQTTKENCEFLLSASL